MTPAERQARREQLASEVEDYITERAFKTLCDQRPAAIAAFFRKRLSSEKFAALRVVFQSKGKAHG